MGSRIVVYEPCEAGEPSLVPLLLEGDSQLVPVSDAEALLDEISSHRPDAVVYALTPGRRSDLVGLHFMRRIAPTLPLVVVASEASLETQRAIQVLRPVYYAVRPVDAEELHEALCAVRANGVRHASGF